MSYVKAGFLLDLALQLAANHRGLYYSDIDDRQEGPTPEARRRSTQRQVKILEQIFGDRLETRQDDRGKYVTLQGDGLRDLVDLRPEELSALDHAIEILRASSAPLDAENLTSLRTKVRLLAPMKARARMEVDYEALLESSHVFVRPGPRPRLDPAEMRPLSEALLAMRQISFNYAAATGETVRRVVHPYGIISGYRAYLIARTNDSDGHGPSTWRVDRMSDITLLDLPASRPEGFDIAGFARRSFGAYHRESEYCEVEWRFKPAVADSALGFSFQPDQQLVREADGSITVRFSASGHLEMAWALYPWGDNVEVIKPEALRQLVENHRRSDFPAVP